MVLPPRAAHRGPRVGAVPVAAAQDALGPSAFRRVHFAAATLLLLASVVHAEDLGVPRDGFDRVLLDDGRVLNARVLPREGDLIPLEFAAGTVRVPRGRVREVRAWKDFDPAPRDDAERAKAAEGFVRWNGVLVPPKHAEKLREEEIERAEKARAAAIAAAPWREADEEDVGRFFVACNAPAEERKHWSAVLSQLSKQVTTTLPELGGTRRSVPVYLYWNEASRSAQRRDDAGRRTGSWGARNSPAEILLGDTSRRDLLPQVLQAAARRLCEEIMEWMFDPVGGWVRHGLPRYFAAGSFEKGALHLGEANDESLLQFREQLAKGTLPRIDHVLRSGNRYWSEAESRLPPGPEDPFEPACAPYAWVLVHFLLEGDGGKHRDAFLSWEQQLRNAKIGKNSDVRKSYQAAKEHLLRHLKMKDVDVLAEGALRHAEGLKYREPKTWLSLARKSWTEKKDAAAALDLVEEAVSRSQGDARALALAGTACAAIEGGAARARDLLTIAADADPLLAEARLELSRLTPGEEGARLRQLSEELLGSPAPVR